MANEGRGNILKFLTGNIVPVAVVLTVFLLFLPIPKVLIDLSMILNLAFAIIIHLRSAYFSAPAHIAALHRAFRERNNYTSGSRRRSICRGGRRRIRPSKERA